MKWRLYALFVFLSAGVYIFATRDHVTIIEGHRDWVNSVRFSPDGRCLASGSKDNTIKIWDTKDCREMLTLRGHARCVWTVAFSPDGEYLASGDAGGVIRVWDMDSYKSIIERKSHTGVVNSIYFSPDGKHLASGSLDRKVKISRWYPWMRGKKTLLGHIRSVLSVCFSPDHRYFASGSWDSTIIVRDAEDYEKLRVLKENTHVLSLCFSPDGECLAVGKTDNAIELYDSEDYERIKTLRGHSGWPLSLSFSRDGKYLASAGGDSTVRIWNMENYRQIKMLRHKDVVGTVDFSSDSVSLASGSHDGVIKIWRTPWVTRTHILALMILPIVLIPIGFLITSKKRVGSKKPLTKKIREEITERDYDEAYKLYCEYRAADGNPNEFSTEELFNLFHKTGSLDKLLVESLDFDHCDRFIKKLVELSEYSMAYKMYQKCGDLKQEREEDILTYERWLLQRAKELEQKRETHKAVSMLQEVEILTKLETPEEYAILAGIYESANKLPEFVSLVISSSSQFSPSAYTSIAKILYEKKSFSDALKMLREKKKLHSPEFGAQDYEIYFAICEALNKVDNILPESVPEEYWARIIDAMITKRKYNEALRIVSRAPRLESYRDAIVKKMTEEKQD